MCTKNNTCVCKPFYEGDGITCTGENFALVWISSSLFIKKKHTIRNKQHSLIFIQTLLVINTSHISTHVLSPPVTNMCQFWNGGCSKNAKCSQKGEKVNCTCLKGYSGDGYVCSTVDLCVKEDNGGCNEHALCTMTGPVSRLFSYFRLVMCCLYIRLPSCYIYFIEYFTWDKNHQSGLTHASYWHMLVTDLHNIT